MHNAETEPGMKAIEAIALTPRIQLEGATMTGSQSTWGFPAITAFTGAAHALERALVAEGHDIRITGVSVICHEHQIHASKPEDDYEYSVHLQRNPHGVRLKSAGDLRKPPAIVEEGKMNLTLTLLLALSGNDARTRDTGDAVAQTIQKQIAGGLLRIAGGNIMPATTPVGRKGVKATRFEPVSDQYEQRERDTRRLLRAALPGFMLVDRTDLLCENADAAREQGDPTPWLTSFLDTLSLTYEPHPVASPLRQDEKQEPLDQEYDWQPRAREAWLVPVPVGYVALHQAQPPGATPGARHPGMAHQFVEGLHSIGAWVSPHRIRRLESCFWYLDNDAQQGIYRVRNDYAALELDHT